MSLPFTTIGRIARSGIAIFAMACNSLLLLLSMFFICCSSSFSFHPESPLFWGAASNIVLALISLPPLSARLRVTPLRWITIPFLISSGVFLWFLMQPTREGVPFWMLIPSVICDLYVIFGILVFARNPG